MKSLYEELNGGYVNIGDVKVPALVSADTNYEIGFWGQRHKKYLKQNHRIIYYNLLTQGKLNSYLYDIDIRSTEMYDNLVEELAKKQDVTEQLKSENQMLWVQLMNNIANQAREVIYSEIIYNH